MLDALVGFPGQDGKDNMWGPLSKADERYYKRKAAEDKARAERRQQREADMPRRMEILARVKSGEITLAQGQRLIRKPNDQADRPAKAGELNIDNQADM